MQGGEKNPKPATKAQRLKETQRVICQITPLLCSPDLLDWFS